MTAKTTLRRGSVHGVRHARLGVNNQDAAELLEFSIPKWGKTYRIGILSDGCTGIPAFTRSEVGANLLALFCLSRIQELIALGTRLEDIPLPLYHAVTSFIRDLSNTLMPATTFWPYPMQFPPGKHEFRNRLSPNRRLVVDYLAATLLGFIDDGDKIVTFQAGDGVIIVNDQVMVTDQNDRPEYPAVSVTSPGGGFDIKMYESPTVNRLALASDGLEDLLTRPELGLPDQLFDATDNPQSLQFCLQRLRKLVPEHMPDDCTVVTLQRRLTEQT
jgi:hypothetical protein